VKRRASSDSGGEQRTIEYRAGRNRKLRCGAVSVTEHHVRTSSMIFECDIADRYGADSRRIDRIADKIQRASGDTATAGLLTRMTAIENRDPYSGAREPPR
jgi:hypothetical protein